MAKTTSQIQAEKKERNKKIEQVLAHSSEVDKQQMADTAKRHEQAGRYDIAKKLRKEAGISTAQDRREDMQRKKDLTIEKKQEAITATDPKDPLKIQKDAKQRAEDRLWDLETDFDWTDAGARKEYAQVQKEQEKERAHRQAAVDQAGKALEEQAVKYAQDSLGALSPEEDAALGAYIMERDSHNANTMNPMVDNPFGPLYSEQARALLDKYGKTAVDAMAEERRRKDSAKITESVAKTAREQANSGGLGAAAASLATVPAQILGGAVGVFDTINSMANGTGVRENLDPNSLGNLGNVYSQNVRGTVAKNLEGDGGFGGKAASIAYQAAMSLADNVARAFFGGAGGATLAATQSFAQTMAAASEQGATPAQAALLATANAGIEYLTEKIPLDDLISVAKGTNPWAIIKNLLRSAGIEAGTEELSLLGTVVAEAAILRENSAYQQEIQGMIDGGMSPEEAKEEANRGFIDEAINTMIVSGLAGGVGGLGASLRGQQVQADADYQAMQQAQEAETESPAQSAGQEEIPVQEAVQSPVEAVPGPVEAMVAAAVQNKPQTEQVQQNPSEDLVNRAVAGRFGRNRIEEGNPTENAESTQTPADIQTENSGQPVPEGMKGTGAAERDFSGKADYADLLREGNVQRDRPGDVRQVEVPKKDGNGRRVTEFAGNAYGSAYTPDYMANEIKTLIQDGKMGFDTRSNQESLRRAAEALEQNTEGVKAKIAENLAKDRIQDGDIEKALLLYVKDANSKETSDQESAAQLLVQLGQMANISGRNLQLFSMLRRMTPEGKLMYVQKAIDQEIARLNKGRSKKKQIAELEIPPALQKDYLNAKTEKETQAALDAIYMDAASKIKPTIGEVWDAWRNMAMLLNPKTHIRNIGATGAFQPFVQVKRMIGTGLEKALLDKGQRTKSVLGADRRSQELLRWAKGDAKKPQIIERMGQTYATGNEARSKIQEYRKIFPGFADKVRKGNMDIMEREDRFFKKGEYARSLAAFLKARGYTAQDLTAGTLPAGVLEEGRTLAIKEAQKATFNDRNAFSDTVAKLGRGVDKIPVIGKIVSKGALPFLRTPANVVARAWDYSPMKLAQTFYQVNQGSIDAATAIDQVSGALTGSAAMALGVALAAGIVPDVELVGKLEDEDEKENGALAYSLRIGDKYYSVSWLSPTMIPLFIGANLYDKFQALGEENGMDGWDVAQAFMEVGAGVVSPMLELSMLSSLNDAIATFAEEDDPGMGVLAALLNSATSYFTQGLPTIFGQAEQATETEKSSTYVNTDNKVERVIKKALGSASRRIPGLDLFQTPRLDEFGQVVKNEGNGWVRAFNAFLNPFNVSQKKTDPISQELSQLRKAGAENASIPLPQRTISYTDTDGEKHADVRLSQEQFQKLAEKQGRTEQAVLSALLDSDDFRAMSDEVKDDVLALVHSYAKETGELAAIKNHLGYSATWMEELAEAEDPAKYIVQRVSGTNLNRAMTDLDTAWGHGWNTMAKERALDEAYEEYKSMSKEAQKEIEAFTTGTAKKYLEARGKGISHEDFLAAAKNVETVQGTGKYNSETKENKVRDIDKREAIAKTTGLSHPQIDIIMKAYMPDYDPTDEKPNKTELKYDYARKELGYSPAEYADIYRAYLEHDKKADKIKEIMKLGYDYGTANQMYKLFQGRVDVVAWAGK